MSVALIKCYAECFYAECRYADCRFAECRYAECRLLNAAMLNVVMHGVVAPKIVRKPFFYIYFKVLTLHFFLHSPSFFLFLCICNLVLTVGYFPSSFSSHCLTFYFCTSLYFIFLDISFFFHPFSHFSAVMFVSLSLR